MSTAVAEKASVVEQVALAGDLSKLSPEDRVRYYAQVCESLGLNPLTRPFDYLVLDGKLVLYARKDCADQLRKLHQVSVSIVGREQVGDVYLVTARATFPGGRSDESVGAVALVKEDGEWKTAHSGKRYFAGNGTFHPLKGDALANALMKAETKAKRRVTLSICGLGMLDETELETVPGVQPLSQEGGAIPSGLKGLPAPAQDSAARVTSPAAEAPTRQGKSLPADGPELRRRLYDHDERLAKQGLCKAGALVEHVLAAGVKAGYEPDLSGWAGPAILLAVEETKAFEQQARAALGRAREAVRNYLGMLGWDEARRVAWLKDGYGVDSLEQLSLAGARAAVAKLRQALAEAQVGGVPPDPVEEAEREAIRAEPASKG